MVYALLACRCGKTLVEKIELRLVEEATNR